MTLQEFSDGFTTLLSSHSILAAFGNPAADIVLDEYEKSLFLTQAQEDIALGIYNGTAGTGFEQTEEARRYLSNLIDEANCSPIESSNNKPLGLDSNSRFFTLPPDLWFITYESATVTKDKCGNVDIEVKPVTQEEYHRIKKNPFRGTNDRRALRLDLSDGVVELISKLPVSKYYVRYLKQLQPIILVNLPEELSINGLREERGCLLNESLHQRILDRAVLLAIQSKRLPSNSKE